MQLVCAVCGFAGGERRYTFDFVGWDVFTGGRIYVGYKTPVTYKRWGILEFITAKLIYSHYLKLRISVIPLLDGDSGL